MADPILDARVVSKFLRWQEKEGGPRNFQNRLQHMAELTSSY